MALDRRISFEYMNSYWSLRADKFREFQRLVVDGVDIPDLISFGAKQLTRKPKFFWTNIERKGRAQ